MTSPGLQLTPDARHDLPGDGADASHATRAEMLAEIDGLVAMYVRYGASRRTLVAIRNLTAPAGHPRVTTPDLAATGGAALVDPSASAATNTADFSQAVTGGGA